ncbi:hypothetical protein scyTo_0015838, partial [Scyliorhinus torazame]|nr:hypothetical protein [Scyliorhinus torazame]
IGRGRVTFSTWLQEGEAKHSEIRVIVPFQQNYVNMGGSTSQQEERPKQDDNELRTAGEDEKKKQRSNKKNKRNKSRDREFATVPAFLVELKA